MSDRPPVSGEPSPDCEGCELSRDHLRKHGAEARATPPSLDVPDALRKAWAFIGGITPDEWATIDKAREAQEHIDALARLRAEQEGEGR